MTTRDELPTYQDLMLPTLQVVEKLSGSAQAREITAEVLATIGATDDQLELTYDKRPKPVLIDRVDWARSYLALGSVLERPRRGLYVLTGLGKEILSLPEDLANDRLREIDREFRARRRIGRVSKGCGQRSSTARSGAATVATGEPRPRAGL